MVHGKHIQNINLDIKFRFVLKQKHKKKNKNKKYKLIILCGEPDMQNRECISEHKRSVGERKLLHV